MNDIVTCTEAGKVTGIISLDYKDGEFCSFVGIPYAKPPLGELRFIAPQRPVKWDGIKDCTEVKNGCISRHSLTAKITGSEDCLYPNVYTKTLPSIHSTPRPVMVWIHGGVFVSGSGNPDVFGPEFLITQDIVIVMMSYRVGPLGFLCLEDDSLDVPGNAGIKDVLMALEWVKNNIQNFNGDPNNITIGGQSSGAVITNFLMLIPKSKCLFHKAILHSATALHSWAIGKREGAKAQVPAVDILKASEKVAVYTDGMYLDNAAVFNPVIEKPHPDAVITDNPLLSLLKGNYTKIPLIMGYTNEEGLYATFVVKNKKVIFADFERMVPWTLKFEKGSPESKRIAKKIKDFYFGDKQCTAENLPLFIKMSSAAFFSYCVHRTARIFMQTLEHPIYFYRFSVDAGLNIYKLIRKYKAPGASHSDDTCYLFNTMLTPKIQEGTLEERVISRMIKLWGSFKKNGNPNSEEEEVKDVSWQPLKGHTFNFLDITNKGLVTSTNPDEGVMHF